MNDNFVLVDLGEGDRLRVDTHEIGREISWGGERLASVFVPPDALIPLAQAIAGDAYTLVESAAIGPVAEVQDGPETEIGGMGRRQFLDVLGSIAINSDIATTYAQKPVGSDAEEDEYRAIADEHFARRNNQIRTLMTWFDATAASLTGTAADEEG